MAIESRNHQGDVKTLTITFQVQTYKELRALGFKPVIALAQARRTFQATCAQVRRRHLAQGFAPVIA